MYTPPEIPVNEGLDSPIVRATRHVAVLGELCIPDSAEPDDVVPGLDAAVRAGLVSVSYGGGFDAISYFRLTDKGAGRIGWTRKPSLVERVWAALSLR